MNYPSITANHAANSKPIPTKKSNPCPVCSNISGKCRTFLDAPIVLCGDRTNPGDTANGYRYQKPASNPLWAVWVPDTEAQFDCRTWQEHKQQRIKIHNVLSVDERDRQFRAIARQSGLPSLRHRQNLEKRGLTASQIEQANADGVLFTWHGKERFSGATSDLPGIDRDRLTRKYNGLAIAATDADGHILGYQVRLDEATDGGRYRWISSETIGGNGIHLPNGEAPMGFYRPQNGIVKQSIGYLAEGFLKPYVAAQKHGIVTIGAPNANHAGSPEQFAAALERASSEFGIQTFAITADGGSVKNQNVINQYRKVAQFVTDKGFECVVAWWGQEDKSGGDVDEISTETLKAAQLLAWDEFEQLCEPPKPQSGQGFKVSERNWQSQAPRDRFIQKRQWKFNEYLPGLKRDFQISTKPSEFDEEYQGYCPTMPFYADTTAVQGGLGSGKTEAILRSLAEYKHGVIIWVAPRNGLHRQTAARARKMGFNTYHYQDDVNLHRRMIECEQPGIYFLTPDCFKEYAVGKVEWENAIVIFDEFSGVRKELLSKTTELPHVLKAIAQAGNLVIADAFLSDADLALVGKYRAGSRALVRQTSRKSPVKINWIETRTQEGEISFSHEGAYLDLLQDWATDESIGRVAIATDTITSAKVLKVHLEALGKKVWMVCSETVEENALFMEHPDATIKLERIDVVIYTPTAQSGIDIQAKFDRGLLIAAGVLPPTQMLQMLGRCRQCREWFVSAPRRAINPDAIAPSLDGKRVKLWAEKLSASFDEMGFNAPSELQGWGVWDRLTGDIEKAFNSEYLQALLNHYFESVETVQIASDGTKRWRDAIAAIKTEDADRTLKGNLQAGLRLIESQKQPSKNSQVWDIKLATVWLKYPKVIDAAISKYQDSGAKLNDLKPKVKAEGGIDKIRKKLKLELEQGDRLRFKLEEGYEAVDVTTRIHEEEQSEDSAQRLRTEVNSLEFMEAELQRVDAEIQRLTDLLGDNATRDRHETIDIVKLFSSQRLERIKNWIAATEPDEQDDENLLSLMRSRVTTYKSRAFKQRQNIVLFRALKLERLARLTGAEKAIAHETHFDVSSPMITDMWEQFQRSYKLKKLFPLVEDQYGLWAAIRCCMRFMGYEGNSCNIRVATEGMHPNGKNREGSQRFSRSKSCYFCGWRLMECSGSAFFKDNFQIILEAIRDRIVAEREERRKWRDRADNPPPEYAVAA